MDRPIQVSAGRYLQDAWIVPVALSLAVMLAVGLILYPTTSVLVEEWLTNPSYSHGILVWVVSVVLTAVVLRGTEVVFCKPANWLVMLTLFFAMGWMFAYAATIQLLQLVFLVGMLYCAFQFAFKPEKPANYLIPTGINVLAVPIWGVLAPLLQEVTVFVCSFVLQTLAWSVLIDGDFVHVRAGSFEIAEGCSGLHFFIVSLVISILFGHLNLKRVRNRILLVAVAAALAMAANWIRVLSLIVIGDVTNMKHYLIAVDHYYYGWVLFFVVLLPMFALGSALRRRELARSSTARALESKNKIRKMALHWTPRHVVAILAFILPAALVITLLARSQEYYGAEIDLTAVGVVGVEARQPLSEPMPRPKFVGAEYELDGYWDDGANDTYVYVSRYVRQRQGAELIGYGNHWYSNDWSVEMGQVEEYSSAGRIMRVSVEVIRSGEDRFVVASAYAIAGRLWASQVRAKLAGAFSALSGDPVSYAIFVARRCTADCRDSFSIVRQRAELVAMIVLRKEMQR